MVKVLNKKTEVLKALADFVLDRKVYKELGEPILFEEGMTFFVFINKYCVSGFAAITPGIDSIFLNYMYVFEGMRGKGIFSKLILAVESFSINNGYDKIKCTATDSALHLYINKGFNITKSWKNYHNIYKDLTNGS